jgi:hypothetical protein
LNAVKVGCSFHRGIAESSANPTSFRDSAIFTKIPRKL